MRRGGGLGLDSARATAGSLLDCMGWIFRRRTKCARRFGADVLVDVDRAYSRRAFSTYQGLVLLPTVVQILFEKGMTFPTNIRVYPSQVDPGRLPRLHTFMWYTLAAGTSLWVVRYAMPWLQSRRAVPWLAAEATGKPQAAGTGCSSRRHADQTSHRSRANWQMKRSMVGWEISKRERRRHLRTPDEDRVHVFILKASHMKATNKGCPYFVSFSSWTHLR